MQYKLSYFKQYQRLSLIAAVSLCSSCPEGHLLLYLENNLYCA